MTHYLLDANVLIALIHPEHTHHVPARSWLGTSLEFATCPITEGALVRFMLRLGEAPTTAARVLEALRANPRHEFWTDDRSYADVGLSGVMGHRQVTDVYLAALAESRGGRLATFDAGIASLRAEACQLLPS